MFVTKMARAFRKCNITLNRIKQVTYSNNQRGEENPAQFPPYTRLVSNHFLDVVIKLVHT